MTATRNTSRPTKTVVDGRDVDKKPAVALDLDALEREGAPIPFDFLLEGKRYLLSDPQEIDWQDLVAALNNPTMFFRLTLPAEDRNDFFASRLPAWKMRILMRKYQDHYGIPDLPNADASQR